MSNIFNCFHQRRVVSKFSLFVGIVAVTIILLTNHGEASPSVSRHKKSVYNTPRKYRSANYNSNSGSPSAEKSTAFNATFDANDGKLCSASGGGDRPLCRKAGLDMKKISLELIKEDILKKLRMDKNKLPNVTVLPPQYLYDFVDMQGDSPLRDDTHDDEHAITEKIIAFSKPESVTSGKHSKVLHHFSFSEKMSNMKIESATLYVHVRYNQSHHGSADKKNTNFNIRILEQLQTKKGESPMVIDYGMFKPSSVSHVRHNRSKWVQIDIRDALSKWISTSVSNSRKITLVIDAVDNSGNSSQEVTVVSSSESDVNNFPFIEVHVSEGGRSRQPRNIGMTCDENSQETRCCKYPLTVDFEEFGWDWIIAPKKYDANYCSGECPFAFLQEYPHNHIVQQAVPSGVGGPCCAARKMSSISMLYFDGDSNILFSVLPGMVVETCGCS